MKLPIYQIDAFAKKPFEGNPAAVIPLDNWLSDASMQAIAEENNLSETAFFVPNNGGFAIRWFTPSKEVKLCGHATLATAFVLFELLGRKEETIEFASLSGVLSVSRSVGGFYTLDFPAQAPEPCAIPEDIVAGLGKRPIEVLKNEDYIAVFSNEEDIKTLTPDHAVLQRLDLRGLAVTAPSSAYDFVARFFAPKYGIPEDPVTGSAYTQLMPYWAEKLGKPDLRAKQLSPRGGELNCQLKDGRVLIAGSAVKYLEGTIEVDI